MKVFFRTYFCAHVYKTLFVVLFYVPESFLVFLQICKPLVLNVHFNFAAASICPLSYFVSLLRPVVFRTLLSAPSLHSTLLRNFLFFFSHHVCNGTRYLFLVRAPTLHPNRVVFGAVQINPFHICSATTAARTQRASYPAPPISTLHFLHMLAV